MQKRHLLCVWLVMLARFILIEFNTSAQAADLFVAKSNDVAGSIALGSSLQWTYVISNRNDGDIQSYSQI